MINWIPTPSISPQPQMICRVFLFLVRQKLSSESFCLPSFFSYGYPKGKKKERRNLEGRILIWKEHDDMRILMRSERYSVRIRQFCFRILQDLCYRWAYFYLLLEGINTIRSSWYHATCSLIFSLFSSPSFLHIPH